jgi:heme exporter protein B
VEAARPAARPPGAARRAERAVSAARALLARELQLALRSGGGAGLGLAFFLIVVLLVPLGIGPDAARLAGVAPGTLWIAALLACLLSLDRLFQADAEDGALDILALAPLPLEGVVALKALAHWLTTGLPLVAVAPLLAVTLSLPPPAFPWLVGALLAGTPALSFLGAIGAAVTVGIRRGGLLLSILVLPLYLPTLIFGARAVAAAAEGADPAPAFLLLAGITLLVLAAAPFAAAAALRINLR